MKKLTWLLLGMAAAAPAFAQPVRRAQIAYKDEVNTFTAASNIFPRVNITAGSPVLQIYSTTAPVGRGKWQIHADFNSNLNFTQWADTESVGLTWMTAHDNGSTIDVTFSANSVAMSHLTPSLPVFTDGTSLLISKAVDLGSAEVTGQLDLNSQTTGNLPFDRLSAGDASGVPMINDSFELSGTLKNQIETLSGATPTLDWDTEPWKFLAATTNITFTDANRPTDAALGEWMTVDVTNSVATDISIILPSGWRNEQGAIVASAGQTVTIFARWMGTEVKWWHNGDPTVSQLTIVEGDTTASTPFTNQWAIALENIDGVQVPYSVTEGGRKVYQWAMVDPRKAWHVRDDFLWEVTGSSEANYIWKFTALNSADHAAEDGASDHPGIVAAQTQTATNGVSQIHLRRAGVPVGDGTFSVDAIFRTTATDNEANPWRARVGYFSQITAANVEPNDGIYLRLSETNANWFFVTRSNNVAEVATDTGVAVSTSWNDATIRVNQALTQAICTINGASFTNTTQLPAAATLVGLQYHIAKWGGTGVNKELHMDFIDAWGVVPDR